MIVRELLTRLGFDADTKEVKKYDAAMASVVKTATAAAAAAAAVSAALFGAAKSTAAAGDAAAKLGRQIGLSAEEVQELQYAEQQAGAEGFTASLGMLNSRLAEAARGSGRAKKVLEDYGIAATDAAGNARRVSDVLPEIADRMAQMSEAEAADLARGLGLTPQSILLLRSGSAALDDARKRFRDLGGVIDNETAVLSEQFNDAFHDVSVIARGLVNTVGKELIPIILEVVTRFREWYVENREIIQQNIREVVLQLVQALRVFWTVLGAVISAVNSTVQAFGGWGPVLKLVISALVGLVALKIAAVMIAIGKAVAVAGGAIKLFGLILSRIPIFMVITALALLIDDLWAFANGADSVTGLVVEYFKALWGHISNVFGQLKAAFLDVWGILPKAADAAIAAVVAAFTAMVAKIRGLWSGVMGWVKETASNLLPDWMVRMLGGGASAAAAPPAPSTMARQSARGAGARGRTDVNTTVTLEVPPGTPESQAQYIREQAGPVIRQEIEQAVRTASQNYAVAEGP